MNKVMIGVITAEMARKAVFYSYFSIMNKPSSSICSFINGQSPARSRNMIVEQAFQNDCTHIFFIDDDIILQKDTLDKLLSHDVDIITGLYLMRQFPHQPIIFDQMEESGRCAHAKLTNENRLVKIVACGLGMCLFKIEVFKDLEVPYVRLGELESDQWCDDLGLFKRIRDLDKYEVHCDLTATVGHVTSTAVWPVFHNDKWWIGYNSDGTQVMTFPMP